MTSVQGSATEKPAEIVELVLDTPGLGYHRFRGEGLKEWPQPTLQKVRGTTYHSSPQIPELNSVFN